MTCRRSALLAGGLGPRDDVGVVAAHEIAAHLRLLLLQHLVQWPLACSNIQKTLIHSRKSAWS